MPCVRYKNGFVCRPRKDAYKPQNKFSTKWCFDCRKRLKHQLIMIFEEGGWYDPEFHWECLACKKDRTEFPI